MNNVSRPRIGATQGVELLLEMWEKLGSREREILLTYGWRLVAGQRKYGLIENKVKEWDMEAMEEAMDAAVYLAAKMMQHMHGLRGVDKEPDLD